MSPYKQLRIGKLYAFNGAVPLFWAGHRLAYFVLPGISPEDYDERIFIGDVVLVLQRKKNDTEINGWIGGSLAGERTSFWYKVLYGDKICYMPYVDGDRVRWDEIKE